MPTYRHTTTHMAPDVRFLPDGGASVTGAFLMTSSSDYYVPNNNGYYTYYCTHYTSMFIFMYIPSGASYTGQAIFNDYYNYDWNVYFLCDTIYYYGSRYAYSMRGCPRDTWFVIGYTSYYYDTVLETFTYDFSQDTLSYSSATMTYGLPGHYCYTTSATLRPPYVPSYLAQMSYINNYRLGAAYIQNFVRSTTCGGDRCFAFSNYNAAYKCSYPSNCEAVPNDGTLASNGMRVCFSNTGCVTCSLSNVCSKCGDGYMPSGSGCTPSCSTGYYMEYNACFPCPPGSYCPDSNTIIKCTLGYYATGGKNACTVCPENYYCPVPSDPPISCDYGDYAPQGSISCFQCPQGHYCVTEKSVITLTICPVGYYCPGGVKTKQICPAGYFCGYAALATPTACPSGRYTSTTGNSVCSLCTEGYYCPEPHMSQIQCPVGYYSGKGQAACTICPIDNYCGLQTFTPLRCELGYYANPGSSACSPCPAGFFCDDTYSLGYEPQPCNPGYYSNEGSNRCYKCPAGFKCSDPSIAPVDCPNGEYAPSGSQVCYICPAGSYCTKYGELYYARASTCPTGMYSAAGSLECTPCPDGYFCPNTAHAKISCPSITYNYGLGLTIQCPPVPKGYKKPSGDTFPTQCALGQYSLADYGECIDCPAGYQCSDPTARPIECEYGYYAPGKNSMCFICPAGYKCPNKREKIACDPGYITAYGEVECHVCPRGWECREKSYYGMYKCEHGYFATSKTMACQKCPAGKYCLFPELNPVDCPDGYYAIGGDPRCSISPAGFFSNSTSKTILPTICAIGYYSEPGATACTQCPANFECIHGRKYRCPPSHYSAVGATACIPCTDGSICSETTYLSTAITDCSNGYYASQLDFTCKLCPPGYYCPSNVRLPTKCPINKYQPAYGQTACLDCLAGSYSPEASPYCMACPDGYKCTAGYPVKCPIGMYGEDTICKPGRAGFTYPAGTKYMLPRDTLCPKGYYCPVNADGLRTDIIPCPPGTYGIIAGAYNKNTHCIACPKGYYCPPATDDYLAFECPASTYCPLATQRPITCPVGTFSEERGNYDSTQCRPNPAGFDIAAGSGSPTVCPKGYYCPGDKKFPCPPGTYSGGRTGLKDISECQPCPAGKYCPEGSIDPQTKAELGYYNPWMGLHTGDYFTKCPPSYLCDTTSLHTFKLKRCLQGYYCPEGTTAPVKCPAGTYSDSYTLSFKQECELCRPGYLCAEGSTSAVFIVANQCPAGYYCPSGSHAGNKMQCPTGTYSDSGIKFIEECMPCLHGYYCPVGTSYTAMQSNNCPPGYYCPENTQTNTSYPCPAGTRSIVPNAKTIDRCYDVPCGLGKMCPTAALTATATNCAAGTYNNFNYYSTSCKTCPAGYKCPNAQTTDPLVCDAGTYSDSGALGCLPCELGYYCAYQGISKSDMLSLYICPAGHFCKNTTTLKGLDVNPDLDGFGCRAGYYCPKGATLEIACPAGTYNPFRGRGNVTDCIMTPAGYYTEIGQSDYKTFLCSEGYYCLQGSVAATSLPCPKGTFRGIKRGSVPMDCAVCTARYYCPTEGLSVPLACPVGKYCPSGTITPIFCPKGTYGPTELLWDSKSCTLCDAGHFCAQKGMIAITDNEKCDDGYYCKSGSMRPEPDDGGISGSPCPIGGFCPKGAASPSLCSAGYLMPITAQSTNTKCTKCPRGKYCFQTNLNLPTGDCQAGYFCQPGAITATPSTDYAINGSYAPKGSAYSYLCPRGTYSKENKSASCDICPDGTLCHLPGASAYVTCPQGYYCPSLSNYAANAIEQYGKIPCPIGTYGASTGLREAAQCTPCTAGKYCQFVGLTTPTNPCTKGYFCKQGAYFPNPNSDPTGANRFGPCPAGSYCPAGTGDPQPCAIGTFSRGLMLYDSTQCSACPSGYYCNEAGLAEFVGKECYAGYYCTENSTSPTQNYCPAKYYCPVGSGTPLLCPPGFYQLNLAQAKCDECPAGYYCYGGEMIPCTSGSYCP